MKKLILILTAIILSLTSYGQFRTQPLNYTYEQMDAYKTRFIADGGTMYKSNLTHGYMQMANENGIAESIEFGWMSGGASKQRVDGINSFYTDLYDFYGTNDATQTKEADQPYVSGNIAPNEVEVLKNPNENDVYIGFTPVDIANNWTITLRVNRFGESSSDIRLQSVMGGSGGSDIRLIGGGIYFINKANSLASIGIGYNYNKYQTYTLVADATTVSLYLNEVHKSVFTNSPEILMDKIFAGRGTGLFYSFFGELSTAIIRSEALTPAQVSAEHALLREIYPEIPSVVIGEGENAQTWSSSNAEFAATPEGNVIKNVTIDADWADATVVYDSVYAATAGTATEKEYAALKESAYWCYYNNDSEIGATYGKLYNWYAAKLLDLDMQSSGYGWRVPTDAQLKTMEMALGMSQSQADVTGFRGTDEGDKLRVPGTDYWRSPNTGATNSSGFSFLGSSRRSENGTDASLTLFGFIWSSNQVSATEAWCRYTQYNENRISRTSYDKRRGFNIRLIKE